MTLSGKRPKYAARLNAASLNYHVDFDHLTASEMAAACQRPGVAVNAERAAAIARHDAPASRRNVQAALYGMH